MEIEPHFLFCIWRMSTKHVAVDLHPRLHNALACHANDFPKNYKVQSDAPVQFGWPVYSQFNLKSRR